MKRPVGYYVGCACFYFQVACVYLVALAVSTVIFHRIFFHRWL